LVNAESHDSTGGRTLADDTYTDEHMEVGMEVEVEAKVEAEVGGVKPSFKGDVVKGGNFFPSRRWDPRDGEGSRSWTD
jgi:hypothetical protein